MPSSESPIKPLAGKRVMLVSATLFSISQDIKEGMERMGAEVDYFDERPGNSVAMKALIRIDRDLVGSTIDRYYRRIISDTAHRRYHYIVFTKGESVAQEHIAALKRAHPDALTVLYHWDAFYYNKNAFAINSAFDRVVTFDRLDASNYGLDFLPLFYTPLYASVPRIPQCSLEYATSFVGTIHSERYAITTAIAEQVRQMGKVPAMYFYFQSRLMFYKRLYFDRTISRKGAENFHFKPLSPAQMAHAYSRTLAMIDVQYPHQSGLTMRTIEALGAGRKIITTNPDIANYDFYDPQNVLIIDRSRPHLSAAFLDSPYIPPSSSVYLSYSLESWICRLLGLLPL